MYYKHVKRFDKLGTFRTVGNHANKTRSKRCEIMHGIGFMLVETDVKQSTILNTSL